MEPRPISSHIPESSAAAVQRQRNRSNQRNWRERISTEQSDQNKQRRREQLQLRIQNMNQEEHIARLEHRRTSQRLRRANLHMAEQNESYAMTQRGTMTNLDEYAPSHSIHEQGSSSNSRQPTNVVTTHINDQIVMRRSRVHGCARATPQTQHVDIFILRHQVPCDHCKAKLFQYENSSMCCNNKTIKLEPIVAPFEMLYLFSDQTPLGRHFRNNIRAYNHVFSFTSMGVHVDETVRTQAQGIYTFRAQGAIYHRIGNLLPDGNERPRFLQLYFFDTDHEIENRINENNGLQSGLLENISTILNLYNPFVNNFRHMAQRADLHNCKLQILELPPNRRQYDLPSASEVAAVIIL